MNSGVLFRRLSAAAFLASCSYGLCRAPLLPLLARELGGDPPTVGLIVGASTLTGIMLKLPAGASSDVLGRRVLLIAAGLVFALMPLAYLGVASLAALALLRVAHGSATAMFGPVAAASLSDIAPSDRRATWLGTLATLQGTGQVVAPVVAGVVLSRAGFDAAFMAAAVIAMAVPVLLWRWPSHHAPADRDRRVRGGLGAVVRNGPIVRTSLMQAALLAVNSAMMAFLPLYAADALGLDVLAIGLLFALQAIAGLTARPLAGRLSDRIGREPMIPAGLIICGLAMACVPAAAGAATLAMLMMASAAGVAMTATAASALVTDRAGAANYGAAHGVFGTIYDVGDALGPAGAGLLVAAIGYTGMFEVAALIALGAAAHLSPGPGLDVGEARARRG
jgi:MFS family permease